MKSTTVTNPFTVVVDSREQAPWTFRAMPPMSRHKGKQLVVPTRTEWLPSGDYSLDGLQDRVAVERKSLADLYSTLGQARDRFEAEVQRLQGYEVAAVIVEASWTELCSPEKYHADWRSQLHPRSVFETISSWEVRYPNVHWCLAGTRRVAEIKCFSVLSKVWKYAEERRKVVEELFA